MKTRDAIEHFQSASALARALGIKPPSVFGWGDTVPALRQFQLEQITGGALQVDPELKQPQAPQQ